MSPAAGECFDRLPAIKKSLNGFLFRLLTAAQEQAQDFYFTQMEQGLKIFNRNSRDLCVHLQIWQTAPCQNLLQNLAIK